MATQLIFGSLPARVKARQRRAKPEVKVLYFRDLLEAEEDDSKVIVPATEQPVQSALFALQSYEHKREGATSGSLLFVRSPRLCDCPPTHGQRVRDRLICCSPVSDCA